MSEAISLVAYIYAMAVVIALGAAALIKLIVSLLSYGDARMAAKSAPMQAPAAAQAPDEAIPAAHLVVIAAAAHAALGAHRILHIGTGTGGPVWSAGGRLAQHSSHRPSPHH